VNGSTLTAPTTTGTCTVVAIKAGDSFYSQKSAKPITIGISNESQNALLASAAQTALALDGKTTLSATGGSGGGAVTFQITSGDCTLNGSLLSAPAAEGTCSVVATKAAEATYAQATSGPITINIVLKTQSALTLFVDQAGLYTAGKATLSVLGGSGTGTVSYTVTSGSCTLVGSTLTAPSTAGTCTVVASKAGERDGRALERVEAYEHARVLFGKVGHEDDAHALPLGTYHRFALEARLVARKVQMRTLVDDKRVAALERVAVAMGVVPEGYGEGRL
jgi:hypothetical protein